MPIHIVRGLYRFVQTWTGGHWLSGQNGSWEQGEQGIGVGKRENTIMIENTNNKKKEKTYKTRVVGPSHFTAYVTWSKNEEGVWKPKHNER